MVTRCLLFLRVILWKDNLVVSIESRLTRTRHPQLVRLWRSTIANGGFATTINNTPNLEEYQAVGRWQKLAKIVIKCHRELTMWQPEKLMDSLPRIRFTTTD